MTFMTRLSLTAAAAICAIGSASAQTVFVPANVATPTLIATLTPGTTYNYSVTGVAALCATCNGGGQLTFAADGKPVATPLGGYAPFAPNGLSYDPTGSGTGIGGSSNLIGALLFSTTPTPTGPADYTMGPLSGTVTALIAFSLYGTVNDTVFNDNSGGYTVTLNAVQAPTSAVPEPASWAMMIAGFGAVGGTLRRRRIPRLALA